MQYLIVALITGLFMAFIRKEKASANNKTVLIPKAITALGFFAGGAGILMAVLTMTEVIPLGVNTPESIYAMSGVFIAIGVALCFIAKSWRIDYNDEGFRYRTIFGRKYEFTYDDIREIREGSQGTRIYTTGKTLTISKENVGVEAFMRICRQKTEQTADMR